MVSSMKVHIGNSSVADIRLMGHDMKLKTDSYGNVFIGFRNTIAIITFEALFAEGRYVEDEDGTPYFLIPGLKLDQQKFVYGAKRSDRTTLHGRK